MRILGFQKKWPKLSNKLFFTTFRYPRRDKDWQVEEVIQIVYKPRTPGREILGIARIVRKQVKDTSKRYHDFYFKSFDNDDIITPSEAYEDGFSGMHGGGDIKGLLDWLRGFAGIRFYREPLVNKLTLYWIERLDD